MEAKTRNAIVHNISFALRPGPHWKLPPALERLLTERARQSLGASWWDDPLQRERLDSAFDQLIGSERQRQAPAYDENLMEAYTFGYLPFHFPKVAELLCNMYLAEDFPETVRILDIGCGPGTASLSAIYFFALLGNARGLFGDHRVRYRVEIVQVDKHQSALDTAKGLIESFMKSTDVVSFKLEQQLQLDITPEENPGEVALATKPFDLIFVQDFFGEQRQHSVTKRKEIMQRFMGWLKSDGALVAIEKSAGGRVQEFHQLVAKTVETGCNLFAPCPAIFDRPQGVKCYSCTASVHRSLVRPRFLEYLCKASSRYDYETVDTSNLWCYAILRHKEGSAAPPLPGDKGMFTQLASLFADGAQIPERANVLVSVASQNPSKPGVYKLCDQSCGAEYNYLHVPVGLLVSDFSGGDVLALTSVRIEKEEDQDEGTVKFHLHIDENTNIMNLSKNRQDVSWKEALEGAGYNA